jgi:hypothetical protein
VSTKFLAQKRLKGLFPVSSDGEEVVAALGKNDLVWIEVSKPRNVGHHRKFFAMLKIIREATGLWETEDLQLLHLKFSLGHVEYVNLPDGTTVARAKSISFAKMDQTQFEEFYDRALARLCELAGGIEEDQVREAVLEELGGA